MLECDANSTLLKTCSVGQMMMPSTAITKIAHAHTNQISIFRASFSLQACCTSNRFTRPRKTRGRHPERQHPAKSHPFPPSQALFQHLNRLPLYLARQCFLVQNPLLVGIVEHISGGGIGLRTKVGHRIITLAGEPAATVEIFTS